jgi:hypothetical protein
VPVNHAPQHFVRRPDRKRCAVPIHCVLNPEKRALLDLWPDQAALSSAMPGMLIWMGMNGRKGSRLAFDLLVDLGNGRWVGKAGGELTR